MTKFVLVLSLVVVAGAMAATDAFVAPAQSTTEDAIGSPRTTVPTPGQTDFAYTVAWTINCDHIGVVGLTPVQDTLLWVSSGGRTGSGDPNWMLIYNLNTRTLVDSFAQFATTTWGSRDMAYDPVADVVYAGSDANRLDVINATTHALVATYTVSGSPTPGVVRAMGYDGGDSLFSANFTSSPVCKFSTTGTNSHQVAPIPPLAIYGLAIDQTRGRAYGSTGDYSKRIIEYDYPSWTVLDSTYVTEVNLFGGCEMWGSGDQYLLVINQGTPDQVLCLDLGGGGTTNDVGVMQVVAPAGIIPPGVVAPQGLIKNFGSAAQSDIPVYCTIDSAGTEVYSDNLTYPGPLAPGSTAVVTFANWTGVDGVYDVTMFTDLSGDENPANDTATGTVTVAASVWETVPTPTEAPDRIVHATIWDPGTDQIFIIGGCPAGAAGTYDGKCQAYAPTLLGWTVKTPMPTPLGWCGYGQVGDKIYMLGGHNNAAGFVGMNQEYDIVGNSWSTKTARPAPLGASLSATWRDTLIYVMGGVSTAGSNRVDIYDPANDAWTVGTALPAIADMGSAVCVGDTIYIAQALNRGSSTPWPNLYKGAIDPANPASINWIMGPSMPTPVFNGATVAIGTDVYWIGGFNNATTVTNMVWKYSQITGAITQFTPNYPTTLARCTYAAARLNADGNEIYVMAGDMLGNWNVPNQTYRKINLGGGVGIEEYRPGLSGASLNLVSTNPVRDYARVSFTVVRHGRVSLGVYDINGSLVRTLVDGMADAGERTVTWDRTDGNGRTVANGTYFYRLVVDGSAVSAKAVVLD